MNKPTKQHYVDNKEFSEAVAQYVTMANAAEAAGEAIPEVPEYIAKCFMQIAEGLSHRPNFARYTYREEMVMDAVENCLRAITNYDLNASTRTGSPNAFAYFTQISFWAFLRRLQKEKKQADIYRRYMEQSGSETFFDIHGNHDVGSQPESLLDDLRLRMEKVHIRDQVLKDFEREERRQAKDTFDDE